MTDAVAGVPTLNPVTAQIPGYALAQMMAQRRLQMAQALTQDSLAPIDYDPKGHISWAQGMAKALNGVVGNSMFNSAAGQEAKLQTQAVQAAGTNYGFQAPGSTTSPATGAQSGPSPQALASALDPRAAAALAQGAQQGSIGPTNANASLMDSMPQPAPQAPPPVPPQAAPQAPPQSGGPGAGQPAPMNPFGAPPMLAWAASQGDPGAQEQLKTWLANQQLTDAQRNARDPLIGTSTVGNVATQNMTPLQKLQLARSQAAPGSPQAQQLDDAISKENYIAPIDAKPGTPVIDPRTMKPVFFAPKVADGVGLDFTNPLQPTASAIPGYAGAAASIVGADQRARQENTLTTVPDAGGAQHTVWGGGQPFGGAPGAPMPPTNGATPQFNLQGTPAQQIGILSQIAANHQDPAVRAAAGQKIAQLASGAAPAPASPPAAAPAQPALGVGPTSTDAAIQKSSADVIGNAPAQLATSKQAITGLEAALRVLPGVRATGPGTAPTAEVLAKLRNAGVPIPDDGINNYQTLSKYLGNSLNAAANGSSAGGSDARFESFMHGQPNAETMDKTALDGAIRYVLSQHDAAAARAQMLPQAYQTAKDAGDPNAALTAQQQWGQAYQPQFFAFNRMSPADQAAFLKAQGQQAPAFVQGYNQYAAKTGWVH